MTPKLYSDDKNTFKIMTDIHNRAQYKCSHEQVNESYKFMFAQFKLYYDAYTPN